MSNKSRHNKLYNYLVNQFKIDTETVMNAIKIRVDELVDEHVKCAIAKYVEMRASQYYDRHLKEYIGKQMDAHMKKVLDEKLKDVKLDAELKLSLTPNLEIKFDSPLKKKSTIRKLLE